MNAIWRYITLKYFRPDIPEILQKCLLDGVD